MDMFDGVGRRQDQARGSFLDIGQHSLNGREHKSLFRNNGDGTFTDVAWVAGADRTEDGRGLSALDYDGDGQIDLLLRNYRQPAVLLHNRGGTRHWIELDLVGVRSNRDAVGARVRLRAASGPQTHVVEVGSGFLSSHGHVVHAGLGAARRVDEAVITWPSGNETTLGDLDADRRYTVVEGTGVVR
jgi:hypothetical protein